MPPSAETSWRWRSPTGITLLVFLGIAAFFLVTEHTAHLIPALPWLLLLSCPFMHVFMHRESIAAIAVMAVIILPKEALENE